MRFEFEGRTYVIEFQRDNAVIHLPEGDRFKRYTSARLFEVNEKGEQKLVRGYKVSCSHHDKFSYEAGRKAALVMALYDAPTKGGGEPVLGKTLTKEFRKAVWAAYHGRPGSKVTVE